MYFLIGCTILVGVLIFFISTIFKNNRLEPAGKCLLITGCDSGVGLCLAIFGHKLGFHLIAACLDNSGEGATLMKEKYPEILVIQMNVTSPEDIKKARELVTAYLLQTKSQLWAVINNAGVLIYGQFDWQTESQLLNQIQVNLVGVMRVTRAFIPLIRKAKGNNLCNLCYRIMTI